MIELNKKQYNLIKPIVENLDEMLEKNQVEDLIIEIASYLTHNNSETDAIYSHQDREIERVMDYIAYNY